MAAVRQVVEEFIDDLDGSKAMGTVKFSFDGKDYLIDLSKKNSSALAKAFAPYIGAGRKTQATRSGRGRGRGAGSAVVQARAVRGLRQLPPPIDRIVTRPRCFQLRSQFGVTDRTR